MKQADEAVKNALDAIPDMSGKVYPLIQLVDGAGDAKEIDLPSMVYAKTGSDYELTLDEPPAIVNFTYQVNIYEAKHDDLDGRESQVFEAINGMAEFGLLAFSHQEDVYQQDGDMFIRIVVFTIR